MHTLRVSVLFSEPKISQVEYVYDVHLEIRVSVLFSEPKIPQYKPELPTDRRRERFSALQRAENSSTHELFYRQFAPDAVSVLFSEPKIPQYATRLSRQTSNYVSVLFSEPKIPQVGAPRW